MRNALEIPSVQSAEIVTYHVQSHKDKQKLFSIIPRHSCVSNLISPSPTHVRSLQLARLLPSLLLLFKETQRPYRFQSTSLGFSPSTRLQSPCFMFLQVLSLKEHRWSNFLHSILIRTVLLLLFFGIVDVRDLSRDEQRETLLLLLFSAVS